MQKLKLGLIIRRLAGSQESFYVTQYMNAALTLDKHEVVVFQEMPVMADLPFQGGIMQISEAFGFDGPLVATRMNLAHKISHFPGTKEKYFYVWDLEWMRMPNKNYLMLAQIYRNPAYKLIARSKEHADIIKQCWNVPVVGIVDNFNIDELAGIIYAERTK